MYQLSAMCHLCDLFLIQTLKSFCTEFILTDSRVMRVKFWQPGEVWSNRRSWQTDSSMAADSTNEKAGESMPLFQ